MKLYLSSYGLGNHPDEFAMLLPENARVAVIANASDYKTAEERLEKVNAEIVILGSLGIRAQELDLRDYYIEKISSADLDEYDGLWVRGGNVFNLARSFRISGFDSVLKNFIEKHGKVYGGYSAGACILSKTLHGIELCDPVDVVPEGLDKDIIWEGLGVINYSIAPHYKSDHPESEDIDKVVAYFEEKNMPYETLRDGEVIIVDGDVEKNIK